MNLQFYHYLVLSMICKKIKVYIFKITQIEKGNNFLLPFCWLIQFKI